MGPRWNVILDIPPDAGGILKTDFKQALKFLRIVDDKELDDEQKAELIIKVFFWRLPDHPEHCWKIIERHIQGPEGPGDGGERRFDWNIDHGRLYASFLQAYGLDLRSAEMHWWTFLELFKGLPKGTAVMEVMELRGKEIPKKGDPKYIRELRKAKRAVSLEEGYGEEKAERLRNMMFGV